jgi:hypothetical protein
MTFDDDIPEIVNWSTLIPEIISKIITLGNLSHSDLYHLMLTCTQFNRLFSTSSPWRTFTLHSFLFKSDPMPLFNWKMYCKHRARTMRECSIRYSVASLLDSDHLLSKLNRRVQLLNQADTMFREFVRKIKSRELPDDKDLLFLVNSTWISVADDEIVCTCKYFAVL